MPHKNRRAHTGFTLIEMVVVLIIITIIFSFAVPNLSRFTGRKKLENEAAKMAGVIDTTKSYAITTRRDYRVHIDAGAKEYYIYREQDTQGGTLPARSVHRDSIHHLDTTVSIAAGGGTYAFNSNGSLNAAGDALITLHGTSNTSIDITINQRTGKVTISDPH